MPAKTREEKRADIEQAAEEAANEATEISIPAAPADAEASASVPTPTGEEDPAAVAAALAAFEAALKSMWPIAGKLVGVQCPLEGYRWLKVWFRINNERAVAELFRLAMPVPTVDAMWAIFPQFVRALEIVPQEDAVPTPEEIAAIVELDVRQPSTFARLYDQAEDLLLWMRREGYAEAIEGPIKKPSAS